MLSLREAIVRVMDPQLGKYPVVAGAKRDDWSRDVGRYLAIALEVIGDIPVEEIKHSHYRALWRHLAFAHIADPEKYGPRAAEMICGALRGAMSWLAQEELVPVNAGLPAPRWKAQLDSDWMRVTGNPILKPAKHRATKEEQAKLFAALPKADPRIRLAVEIGAELRLGQVVRVRRSDIYAHRPFHMGGIIVHGRGHKHGADVLFTEHQRKVICIEMCGGYLAELERAFQAELLNDYLLIAGGFHADGKAQVCNAMRPLSMRALRNYWMQLEEIAGVEHVPGRGWYQLRRSMADNAEDVCNDERALNEMGGWTDSQTRHGYQQQGRIDIREKVRDVREQIRPTVKA